MCVDLFSAGCISKHLPAWEKITLEPEVLKKVKGMKLELQLNPSQLLVQHGIPSENELLIEENENKLLKRGAGVPCKREQGNFI